MPNRPDALQGRAPAQRLAFEQSCIDYLADNDTVRRRRRGERIDSVVAMRFDLDHPLLSADNVFGDCAECGANLQFSPTVPKGVPVVCVCCAAALLHEKLDGG